MNQNSESLLKLEQVSYARGGRFLLDQIDMELHPGEVVTIIGPNGAGKTTLLRVALGLMVPQQGKITQRPQLKIGYMPQKLQLDPTFPLTVRRFLAFACANDERRACQLLQEVGAEQVYQSAMKNLSGGELQRVLLARALVRQPDLLVLDEPVQGVDVHGQVELYQLISRIRDERGCAVLMVSHDLHLVMAATDRVLCLNHHICCSGTPEAVTAHPAYARLFGPLAGEQLAVYVHDPNHEHEHDFCSQCNSGRRCQ